MARRPKPANLEPLLDRMMALAEPSRWSIMRLLGVRSLSVGEIARATGLSLAVTSRHVQRLRAAGLVIAKRRGKELLCSRSTPDTPTGSWLAAALQEDDTASLARDRAPRESRAVSSREVATASAPEKTRRPGGDLEDYLL